MKKKNFLIISVIVIICVIIGASWYVYYRHKTNEQNIRKETKEAVLSYKQKVNNQGIAIDMRKNPYFNKKQPGYEYKTPEVIEYYSNITKNNRKATVMLPYGYDKSKKYPVLYLLHGLGGGHRTWRNKKADIIIQNVIYFNEGKEMIVVCPNSELNKEGNTNGLSDKEKAKFYDLTEKDLMNNLIPYINEHYPVKTDRDSTAIAGNSMGGRNSLYIAFKNQEKFGYVGAFSSASVLGDTSDTSKILRPLAKEFKMDEGVEPFKMLMLMVGTSDDVCGNVTYELHDHLNKNGVEHIFYDVEGGHDNVVWQNALYNFVKKLFK